MIVSVSQGFGVDLGRDKVEVYAARRNIPVIMGCVIDNGLVPGYTVTIWIDSFEIEGPWVSGEMWARNVSSVFQHLNCDRGRESPLSCVTRMQTDATQLEMADRVRGVHFLECRSYNMIVYAKLWYQGLVHLLFNDHHHRVTLQGRDPESIILAAAALGLE